MKKHSIFFIPNIVLGVILAVVAIADILIVLACTLGFGELKREIELYSGDTTESDLTWNSEEPIQGPWEDGENPEDYFQWYQILSVESADTQLIGDSYMAQTADPGMQFYRVTISIKNQGTQSTSASYLGISFTGAEYGEVMELDMEYDDWSYYKEGIIPPAQTATVEQVVMIKDGVTQIQMEYYSNSDSRDSYKIEIK